MGGSCTSAPRSRTLAAEPGRSVSTAASSPSGARGVALRALLFVAGIAVLAWLVVETGPGAVWATLIGGARVLPLIMVFDFGYFVAEALAHRAVLGDRADGIPRRVFVRTTLIVYVVNALLPLGRAGAEVARAAAFSRYVGVGRATAAGTNVQVTAFVANTFISSVCWIASASMLGPGHLLSWLLLGNGALTFALAAVTFTLLRQTKLGRVLGARFPKLAERFSGMGEGLRATPRELGRAALFACSARVVQIGMYAFLLIAIGATLTLGGTLLALGVHLVGAGLGDLVPNQVGVLEGVYRVFADALSLGDDPARAISIALLARVSQVGVAALAMVSILLLGREGEESSDAIRSDVR
jgi:hypothetical protein